MCKITMFKLITKCLFMCPLRGKIQLFPISKFKFISKLTLNRVDSHKSECRMILSNNRTI